MHLRLHRTAGQAADARLLEMLRNACLHLQRRGLLRHTLLPAMDERCGGAWAVAPCCLWNAAMQCSAVHCQELQRLTPPHARVLVCSPVLSLQVGLAGSRRRGAGNLGQVPPAWSPGEELGAF